tara:strand:+ start:827 stop:1093 length:267 start_codon:yes stop_codon:yes gene_type:complete
MGSSLPSVLLNASLVQKIDQTSTTTTTLSYNAIAATDVVTITHSADASGVAIQNFLVEQLGLLMRTSYTNVAPVVSLPGVTVSMVAIA